MLMRRVWCLAKAGPVLQITSISSMSNKVLIASSSMLLSWQCSECLLECQNFISAFYSCLHEGTYCLKENTCWYTSNLKTWTPSNMQTVIFSTCLQTRKCWIILDNYLPFLDPWHQLWQKCGWVAMVSFGECSSRQAGLWTYNQTM